MALSGKVETGVWTAESGSTWKVVLNWTATQSVANNTSTISWSLDVSTGSSGYVVISELRVKIGGEQVYYRSSSNHTNGYNGTHLADGTTTVSHNNDGTKSVEMSVEAGIYNWAINKSGSATFTLDTIARASSISSAGNVTLENACSVQWTPASSSFTYKIKFSLGTWSYTTGTISPNTTSAYTYTGYTIPVSVANQLPNATSGTMTATLYTYNGSTQIGSAATKTFTVTVPTSVIPTVDAPTVTIDNSANSVVAGWGLYVVGYSKARIKATASGAYGSTISTFTISGGYSATQTATSLDYTGGKFSTSGNKTFTVSAKDSRGRASEAKTTGAITVYAYSIPKITAFTVGRSTTNAKKMVVNANWAFASVNNKNSASGILYYKKSTDSEWIQYGAITKNTAVTLTNEFLETSSYNFKLVVTDALSESAQEETFVSTISVLLDFRAGGKGLGIGKIAETDRLEVDMKSVFMQDVYIQTDSGEVTLADYIKSVVNS